MRLPFSGGGGSSSISDAMDRVRDAVTERTSGGSSSNRNTANQNQAGGRPDTGGHATRAPSHGSGSSSGSGQRGGEHTYDVDPSAGNNRGGGPDRGTDQQEPNPGGIDVSQYIPSEPDWDGDGQPGGRLEDNPAFPSVPSVPSLPDPSSLIPSEPDWDGDGSPGGNLSDNPMFPSLPSVPSLPDPSSLIPSEPDWDGDGSPGGPLVPDWEIPELQLPELPAFNFEMPAPPEGQAIPPGVTEWLAGLGDFLGGSADEEVGRRVAQLKMLMVAGAVALGAALLLSRGESDA